jgi:cation:H+ antiporter
MIALYFLLLVVGFVLLTKGADWLVKGATFLAKRANMSDMAIGLTIVALGTSLPELIVSFIAAVKGQGDVAVGNVLGSNIVNILLVLGITGTIGGLFIQKNTIRFEIPLSILVTFLLLFLVNGFTFHLNGEKLEVSRWDALILLGFFLFFMGYVAKTMKESKEGAHIDVSNPAPVWKSLLLLLVGIVMLAGGGKLVVDNALLLAQMAGISERIIGLTIVAIGTSLPELATSVMAAIRKKMDIAIGNVVGSNIFNIGFVLGVSGLIKPIPYNAGFNFDLLMVLIASFLLLIFSVIGFQKHMLERWEAIILLFVFTGYTVWLVV